MIKIVDYGLGNVLAFLNVYKRLNIQAGVAKTAGDLEGASRVILPGVGAFDHAMELLQQSGMRETLDEMVLSRGVPVLGICVGMQILATDSEEGHLSGLSWIKGAVRKLKGTDEHKKPLHLPHMGWNDVEPVKSSPLFAGLETDARFYFLHSYHFTCASRESRSIRDGLREPIRLRRALAQYLRCSVSSRKSHQYGTRLLQNFAEI